MKMRLVCISDTHNKHNQLTSLPGGDVLAHAGDFCMQGNDHELYVFYNWLDKAKSRFSHVVLVPGNHDFVCERYPGLARGSCPKGCHFLVDEAVEINGIKFYGAPWVPNLRQWAFYGDENKLRSKWNMIPHDVDVLVTHGPPYKMLDDVARTGGQSWPGWEESVGCQHLARHCKRAKPKYHIFGHIHECGGQTKEVDGITYVNASVLDENYAMAHDPIVLELEEK
jgi:Icc-related predicted phosphoesterase